MGASGNKWYLRQAAYMSMRRLGLDRIDLYYLHTPTFTDTPFEQAVETLAGMKQDGLIRHIGLSNVSADQLLSALAITDIAAVTVHYNVAVRLGAAVRAVAEDKGIVFSPWHPAAVPGGDDGVPFHAVLDPIAANHDATPQQIALAWQLQRTPNALPIPGTTSLQHLQENLAASRLHLADEEVAAITALASEAAHGGHPRGVRDAGRSRPTAWRCVLVCGVRLSGRHGICDLAEPALRPVPNARRPFDSDRDGGLCGLRVRRDRRLAL